MPTPPRPFLILPCPVLRGAGDGVLLETTFTAGGALPDAPYPDVATPGSGNRGGIQVSQSGVPTARQKLDYRLTASGGVWNGAAWAWKRSTETTPGDNLSVIWRGANDGRYWHAPHDPFGNDGDNPGPTRCVAYSSLLRKEFVYRVNVDGLIQCATRTVDSHAYSAATWTVEDCVVNAIDDLKIPSNLAALVEPLQVIELDDGTLMMVTIPGQVSSAIDFIVLHSTDGIRWTVVCDDLLGRFSTWGRCRYGSYGLQMQKSGGYVRLCFVHYDYDGEITAVADHYIRSLVSSDRGSTWKEVSDTSAQLIADFTPSAEYDGGVAAGSFRWALGSLDDLAGSFFLMVGKGTYANTIHVHSAVGMQGWEERTDLQIEESIDHVGSEGHQIACIKGPDYVYLFSFYKDSSDMEKCDLYLIDPRTPFTEAAWKKEEDLFKDFGAMRMRWRQISLANVGNNYLAVTAALWDAEDGVNEPNGMMYLRFGGWDQLPVEERDHPLRSYAPPYQLQPGIPRSTQMEIEYQLATLTWDAWMGAPTPPAGLNVAATSPWTRPDWSSTVQDWNTSRVKYTDVTASPSQWANRKDVASPLRSWFSAIGSSDPGDERGSSGLEWIIRIDQGGSVLSDSVALRLKSYDVNGGSSKACDLSIQMNGDTSYIRVYDNVAGAVAITAALVGTSSSLSSGYWKFRLGLLNEAASAAADIVKLALWARDEEDETAQWTLLGRGNLSMLGSHTQQRIDFGHLTLETSINDAGRRISRWRRVALYGPHDAGMTRCVTDGWGRPGSADDTVLDNLRGRPATFGPVLVEKGIKAQLQGGAGMETDTWAGDINYAFHPRNVTMIGSPRIGFRSAIPSSGTTAVNLDYDAGWDDTGRAFQHGAFAYFGYAARSMTVLYADNTSFVTSGNSGTSIAIDGTLYGPTRVASTTNRNAISVALTDPECPPLGECSSVEGGPTYFMQVTAASCSTAVGKVYIVENDHDWSSSRRVFTVDPGDDDITSYGLSGASVVFFADRGSVILSSPQNFRYMRISMPSTVTAYANQHRLGTFIAGTTLVLTGLDWSHTDAEQSNNTQNTAKGGLRWGYPEGPPQRKVDGLITGDIDSVRRRMRSYLRALSGYDEFPVVWVADDSDVAHPAKLMLGTVTSGSDFQQDAWKWDDAQQRWLAVGNMKLGLAEEV